MLHLDYEQGVDLNRTRYRQLASARGVDLAELIRSGTLRVSTTPLGKITDVDFRDELELQCESRALCVIDSFRTILVRSGFSSRLD